MSRQSKRILITGSNGLLGQKLVSHCLKNNINFLASSNDYNRFSLCPDKRFSIMDITQASQVQELIAKYQPTHIINAAAMTNVDTCEINIEACNAVNVGGVKNLLDAIENTNIHLTQISTDFIFDGNKKLYSENDTTAPLNVYGKSKLDAEILLLKNQQKQIAILRTSLLYGTGESLKKSNIFNWAMDQLRDGKELNIVDDQFRTATFVDDLVQACIKVVNQRVTGVYNIAGAQLLSMYEYILLLAEYIGVDKSKVIPINSSKLSQKANRPKSSGLLIDKAHHEIDYKPTEFIESLFKIDPSN